MSSEPPYFNLLYVCNLRSDFFKYLGKVLFVFFALPLLSGEAVQCRLRLFSIGFTKIQFVALFSYLRICLSHWLLPWGNPPRPRPLRKLDREVKDLEREVSELEEERERASERAAACQDLQQDVFNVDMLTREERVGGQGNKCTAFVLEHFVQFRIANHLTDNCQLLNLKMPNTNKYGCKVPSKCSNWENGDQIANLEELMQSYSTSREGDKLEPLFFSQNKMNRGG